MNSPASIWTKYTLREPKPSMPLYHLIGALDPLTDADIQKRIGDGLPETLPEWINADGLTHMKIKLNGDNLDWDVDRVLAVDRIASETQAARGCSTWYYSADFNEKCENVEYVLGFLRRIQESNPAAFERLQYIEQPTSRDLKAHAENKMHEAAKDQAGRHRRSPGRFRKPHPQPRTGLLRRRPQSLQGPQRGPHHGRRRAEVRDVPLRQDLTCPGASFLHSASLSARIPTVAAIEGNARQFVPVANEGWKDRFPSMFNITDGTLGTAALDGVGLGGWRSNVTRQAVRAGNRLSAIRTPRWFKQAASYLALLLALLLDPCTAVARTCVCRRIATLSSRIARPDADPSFPVSDKITLDVRGAVWNRT